MEDNRTDYFDHLPGIREYDILSVKIIENNYLPDGEIHMNKRMINLYGLKVYKNMYELLKEISTNG